MLQLSDCICWCCVGKLWCENELIFQILIYLEMTKWTRTVHNWEYPPKILVRTQREINIINHFWLVYQLFTSCLTKLFAQVQPCFSQNLQICGDQWAMNHKTFVKITTFKFEFGCRDELCWRSLLCSDVLRELWTVNHCYDAMYCHHSLLAQSFTAWSLPQKASVSLAPLFIRNHPNNHINLLPVNLINCEVFHLLLDFNNFYGLYWQLFFSCKSLHPLSIYMLYYNTPFWKQWWIQMSKWCWEWY